MPSPDLSSYSDLVLYDAGAGELLARALDDAAAKLPDWAPRSGNTEVVLLEALALIAAEQVYAINRLPGASVEVLLRLFGVERSLGVPPTATVTFALSTLAGYTLPAGTLVRLVLGDETVDFTTDVEVTVAPGVDVIEDVAVTASTSTDSANGTPAGTPLLVVSPQPAIDSAELSAPVAAGADPEDTDTWITRGIQRLGRLVTTLVLPEHFTAYALENPLVYRAFTIDLYDGAGPVGVDPGHVTTAVLGVVGAPLSAGDKAALAAEMDALSLVNLASHVIDPTITQVAVVATVQAAPGYDPATVEANVMAALEEYLSPDTWQWGAVLRRNDLIALIESVEGVDFLQAGHPTAPAADVALAGAAPLLDLDVAGTDITVV